MPNSIKAVLFDLGGTLASTADVPEIFARILRAHGIEVSRHEISEVHRQNQEEFSEELMAERGPDFWVRWNLRILEGIGVEKDAEFLARKIDELWFDYADLSVYSDVMETLVQLKARKIKIG
ncbi:MAG: HAD family hydrolase, partial [Candidatus Bathyarchaeia archaeon]